MSQDLAKNVATYIRNLPPEPVVAVRMTESMRRLCLSAVRSAQANCTENHIYLDVLGDLLNNADVEN